MAELATAIGVSERHYDKVALLHLAHFGSDCFDHPDGLVAHAASSCSGLKILIGPEIAAADTASRDTHERIGWFDQGCVRHVFDTNVPGTIHDSGTHRIYLCLWVGSGPLLYCSSVTF